jgi:4-hydroxybenzoate polyprenyltransferase
MKLALFITAGLLAIAWILGYFIVGAGAFIHILVISAALSFMQAIIVTPKPQPISD